MLPLKWLMSFSITMGSGVNNEVMLKKNQTELVSIKTCPPYLFLDDM